MLFYFEGTVLLMLAMLEMFRLRYWVYIMLMSILQTWAAGRISAFIKQLTIRKQILALECWWDLSV